MTKYATRLLLAAAVAAVTPVHAGALERAIYLISQTSRGQAAEGRSEGPAVDGNGILTAYTSNALNLTSPPQPTFRDQIYLRNITDTTSSLVSKGPDGKARQQEQPAGRLRPRHQRRRPLRRLLLAGHQPDGGRHQRLRERLRRRRGERRRRADQPRHRRAGQRRQQLRPPERRRPLRRLPVERQQPGGRRHQRRHRRLRVRPRRRRHAPGEHRQRRRETDGQSITPTISDDGRYVAFASRATNLVAPPTGGAFEQIYVADWQTQSVQLASVNDQGVAGNAISFLPDLTADGGQVAFKSEAFNLVPNDTNGEPDVFVRDLSANTTQRVSVDDFGNQSNGLSGGPGISADGRFVAFASFASNFVPDDGNGFSDVYVYDRFPPGRDQGLIARVTIAIDDFGEPNDGVADFPVSISADGRWIGFASAASNLVENDLNNDLDAFLACNPFDAFQCAPPTPTPTPVMEFPCVGDCTGDGQVTIDDLIRMVGIALGLRSVCGDDQGMGACLAGDANCDCQITVDEIIQAVNNSLNGCTNFGSCSLPDHEMMCCEAPPTPGTPTATPTPSMTPHGAIPTATATPTPPATPTATRQRPLRRRLQRQRPGDRRRPDPHGEHRPRPAAAVRRRGRRRLSRRRRQLRLPDHRRRHHPRGEQQPGGRLHRLRQLPTSGARSRVLRRIKRGTLG